jgi:hypothetical protein
MTLLFFFIMMVGYKGVWVVSGFRQVGREALQRKKTSSSPAYACPKEEEDT